VQIGFYLLVFCLLFQVMKSITRPLHCSVSDLLLIAVPPSIVDHSIIWDLCRYLNVRDGIDVSSLVYITFHPIPLNAWPQFAEELQDTVASLSSALPASKYPNFGEFFATKNRAIEVLIQVRDIPRVRATPQNSIIYRP